MGGLLLLIQQHIRTILAQAQFLVRASNFNFAPAMSVVRTFIVWEMRRMSQTLVDRLAAIGAHISGLGVKCLVDPSDEWIDVEVSHF